MNKVEKAKILKSLENISNEELEDKYYEAVYNSLGSECEQMYDMGYTIEDIEEQDKYESWASGYADVLEQECRKRGIELWTK